ncbi:hypothetical protein N180_14710 [Pedobacter antarcticus 4BY]|uniref:DUF6984 domain-containing protein n=2 Tax=Pedobacter antarcticus TaxID=34086 RepID=A0A081PI40_9SPHI|nr:hypothetical protein [Pedobacter antarcticus]KEQ30363.1 hypothetical protein N180_14710 [Pedobacter antarcticus 4BY]SFE73000.1 hypothetical protein SAMN03003324_01246 [Pedobacter antarcticus]
MLRRKLNPEEVALITWMIKDTDEGASIIDILEELVVEEMEDGRMGSLRVVVEGEDNRLFSRELATADLFDADLVPVFISVNLDTEGHFFELDVFKADFSPLKNTFRPPSAGLI